MSRATFCGERTGLPTAAMSAMSAFPAVLAPLGGNARHADAAQTAAAPEMATVTARNFMNVSCDLPSELFNSPASLRRNQRQDCRPAEWRPQYTPAMIDAFWPQ